VAKRDYYAILGVSRDADEGELKKVRVDREDDETPPIALWVRADGLPVRARSWPRRGEPAFEMRLD